MSLGNCVVKAGHVMAAIDCQESRVMSGLKSEFQPNENLLLVGSQQPQDLFVETVRPCAYGKAHHTLMLESTVVEVTEMRNRRVGVGERLEVGNELGCP